MSEIEILKKQLAIAIEALEEIEYSDELAQIIASKALSGISDIR